jgi:hypothetical protein
MCTVFAVGHDPRRQHPTTLHTLETILTITILALNLARVAALNRSRAATGGSRRVGCGAPQRLRAEARVSGGRGARVW